MPMFIGLFRTIKVIFFFIILKYFVRFPVTTSISCEQSSQVHGEKDGLEIAFHMLRTFKVADLNLDFLSVRILCSTFARTDSQETLLALDLD